MTARIEERLAYTIPGGHKKPAFTTTTTWSALGIGLVASSYRREFRNLKGELEIGDEHQIWLISGVVRGVPVP